MHSLTTAHFDRAFQKAPVAVQKIFIKQAGFLLSGLQHPSLRAKKYDATRWQGRVTRDWRFYFRIEGDAYILLDIIRHPK